MKNYWENRDAEIALRISNEEKERQEGKRTRMEVFYAQERASYEEALHNYPSPYERGCTIIADLELMHREVEASNKRAAKVWHDTEAIMEEQRKISAMIWGEPYPPLVKSEVQIPEAQVPEVQVPHEEDRCPSPPLPLLLYERFIKERDSLIVSQTKLQCSLLESQKSDKERGGLGMRGDS